jgi:hypothetical protein
MGGKTVAELRRGGHSEVRSAPGDRLLFAGAALFIGGYFLWLAGSGLRGYFSGDDLMNLGQAAATPVWTLVKQNILFFSGGYRPMGAAWYRLVYALAGFEPFPFHAAAFVLLGTNLLLTYSIARRLSGSRQVGAITTLLVTYHPHFPGLYYDTGTIYEILAYFFYFSAFLLYVRIRESGRLCNVKESVAVCLLYVCAVNSKESGLTLPLALIAYELLYRGPSMREFVRPWTRWARKHAVIFACGALGAIRLVDLFAGPSALARQEGYQPVFTLTRVFETSSNFLNHLCYQTLPWFTPLKVILVCGLLVVLALLARNRAMWFGLLVAALGSLPVDFIPPRAASAYYISLFGLALYAAAGLSAAVSWIANKIPGAATNPRTPGVVLFLTLALAFGPLNRFQGEFAACSVAAPGERHRAVLEQFRRAAPTLKPAARLFFLTDPVRPGYWDLQFLIQLAYHDSSLRADTCGRGARPTPASLAKYDYIFDYAEGRFIELTLDEARERLAPGCLDSVQR